jgi:RNase P subunit RPR2
MAVVNTSCVSCFSLCAALAQHLLSSMRETAQNGDVRLSDSITQCYCPNCSSFLMPVGCPPTIPSRPARTRPGPPLLASWEAYMCAHLFFSRVFGPLSSRPREPALLHCCMHLTDFPVPAHQGVNCTIRLQRRRRAPRPLDPSASAPASVDPAPLPSAGHAASDAGKKAGSGAAASSLGSRHCVSARAWFDGRMYQSQQASERNKLVCRCSHCGTSVAWRGSDPKAATERSQKRSAACPAPIKLLLCLRAYMCHFHPCAHVGGSWV